MYNVRMYELELNFKLNRISDAFIHLHIMNKLTLHYLKARYSYVSYVRKLL